MAHILIANDDKVIANMAMSALIDAGHACGWIDGGRELLGLLRWRQPDILVLDENLSEAHLAIFFRELRQSGRYEKMSVIMLVADESRRKAHGMDAAIVKPFSSVTLLGEVERLLEENPTSHRSALAKYVAQAASRWRDAPDCRRPGPRSVAA